MIRDGSRNALLKDKPKFKSVSGDLFRPGHDGEQFARAARRARGERTRLVTRAKAQERASLGTTRRLIALTWIGLFFLALYVATVGAALLRPGYNTSDRIASVFLALALGFVALHGVGYAGSMLKALAQSKAPQKRGQPFASAKAPRVACLIASFNEPPEVLEETVAAVLALDYPDKEVVLLDDSTRELNQRAARDIAQRYGIQCVSRTNRRGFKAGAINDFLRHTHADFLALFDADALPSSEFLRDIVPQLEENPRLGWVQTPQFYANTSASYTAMAAARQQNVFYEYICEGKSRSHAAFCCGTNVVFRKRALEEVGGFDESSVTEDFATSFELHLRGWDSRYVNRVYVLSLAPETLGAYFTQQSRWAFGSMGTLGRIVRAFFKNPRALKAGQWWEYFLSATYYWVGLANLIFLLMPMLTLFFGIKPLRQDALTYALVLVPYLLWTMHGFYAGMEARGFRAGETVLGQQIGFLSFPTQVAAGLSVLTGRKRPFGVTPKGVGGRTSFLFLWPQLLMLALSALACGWGLSRYFGGYERDTLAALVNAFWAGFHVWMLSALFRLNRPVREGSVAKDFFRDETQARPATLSPLRGLRNPFSIGRAAAVLSLLTLGVFGAVGASIVDWNRAPQYPVNVLVLDRTGAGGGIKHQTPLWTLNFLKVRKQNGGPLGAAGGFYNAAQDYFGFFPDPKPKPHFDSNSGESVILGGDRSLPSRLPTPGVLYIADTLGEFRGRDASGKAAVFRARKRGLSPDEVDAIGDFANRGGLVMAQWNTLGYPTRPGAFVPEQQMAAALETARKRRQQLERVELARAQSALDVAQSTHNFRVISKARGKMEDVRGQIISAEYRLRALQNRALFNAIEAKQARAATKLEGLLHVSYAGWYGRFVEDFAAQRTFDPALYASVKADLNKRSGSSKNASNIEPSGPGFVFYRDGGSEIFDPATQTLKRSPLARPVAILGADLGGAPGEELAQIKRTEDAKLSDDPLLRGVRPSVPARMWFDVVAPHKGARVLAFYELRLTSGAAKRLKASGFPANLFDGAHTTIRFPALIAYRDGDSSRGELRSLYFGGEASGYGTLGEAVRRFPALGGVDRAFGGRFGAFSSKYYWGYYEPVLRNVFDSTPRVRFASASNAAPRSSKRNP